MEIVKETLVKEITVGDTHEYVDRNGKNRTLEIVAVWDGVNDQSKRVLRYRTGNSLFSTPLLDPDEPFRIR